jgi:hypothetical protein
MKREVEEMYVYVSGPYSPRDGEMNPTQRARVIEENIEKANEVALAIARKGHFPFVPHTMMRGWEDSYGISRGLALHICHRWVEQCDALFFIGDSPGAISELEVAQKHHLKIYTHIDDIYEAHEVQEEATALKS